MRDHLKMAVEVDVVGFGPNGITLMVDRWGKQSLILMLCEGWAGEFFRISPTTPLFSLRQVRPATDQDRRLSVGVLNVLWRRPEFHEADQAISAFLPLAHPIAESETPTSDGADHHES